MQYPFTLIKIQQLFQEKLILKYFRLKFKNQDMHGKKKYYKDYTK